MLSYVGYHPYDVEHIAQAINANAIRHPDVIVMAEETRRLCKVYGLNLGLVWSQILHETGMFLATPSQWQLRCNPAGIKNRSGDAFMRYYNGVDAARAMISHVTAYLIGANGTGWEKALRPDLDPRCAQVMEIAESTDKLKRPLLETVAKSWAEDPQYADKVAATYAAYFGTPEHPQGWKPYAVAGLSKPVYLPVPLVQNILPISIYNRPGTARQTPGYWVQHETDNAARGADAAMHARYLLNGPVDADGNRMYVSWHFTADDHQIVQHVPITEITYQAADGNGPGNMSGVSCEGCVNIDGNEAAMRHNAEALCGGIMAALGLKKDRIKRHWDFNAGSSDRHHCPDHMMTQNYWPTFVKNATKVGGL